ncbi:hypothetical protein HK100_004923 [Physocladia obscura]|uniref:Uncharacterized protein n=1 Tax=Physocladia obscura TaxID=109957 RepID=A0AAD5XJE4_9FUNG|nr:hypothetical protein HK100_004923 [Physocladia obscura]
MIGELARDEKSRALGYSWYGIVYGICGVIGAVMGGYLADPILFVGIPVFEKRPYLLACGVGVVTAICSGVTVYYMLQQKSMSSMEADLVEPEEEYGDEEEEENEEEILSNEKDTYDSRGYAPIAFDIIDEDFGGIDRLALLSKQHYEKPSEYNTTQRRYSGYNEVDITESMELETMQQVADSKKFKPKSAARPQLRQQSESSDPANENTQELTPDSIHLATQHHQKIKPKNKQTPPRPNNDFYSRHIHPYLHIVTRKTILPLSLYTLFALSNSIFYTALSLICAAPVSRGGYNLGQRVAFWSMGGYAAVKIAIKAVYYRCNAAVGTRWCFRIGVAIMVPAVLMVPARVGLDWSQYYESVVQVSGNITTVGDGGVVGRGEVFLRRSMGVIGNAVSNGGYEVPVYALVALTSIMGLGDGLTYLSVVMLITESVPETQYGLIHGLGGCLASIVRTVGPTFGGILWEVGGASWVVFLVVALVIIIEFASSFLA